MQEQEQSPLDREQFSPPAGGENDNENPGDTREIMGSGAVVPQDSEMSVELNPEVAPPESQEPIVPRPGKVSVELQSAAGAKEWLNSILEKSTDNHLAAPGADQVENDLIKLQEFKNEKNQET